MTCETEILENIIKLSVREDGRLLGYYNLHIHEDYDLKRLYGNIFSYQRNSGIPRLLIGCAVKEIDKLAKETGETYVHNLHLNSDKSRSKLLHIYLENGYKDSASDGKYLYKVFESHHR